LKKNCVINSKIAMKNFSHVRLTCKSLNFMVLGYLSMKSQNHGNPYAYIFKLQEDFSEVGIRVILDNGIGSFQTFLILQI
jgi:hypothetical protein